MGHEIEDLLGQPIVSFTIEGRASTVCLCQVHYNSLYSKLNTSAPCGDKPRSQSPLTCYTEVKRNQSDVDSVISPLSMKMSTIFDNREKANVNYYFECSKKSW